MVRLPDAGRQMKSAKGEGPIMAEITSGLRSILSLPLVYEAVQRVFGARSGRPTIVDRFIRPKPGDRILDVGCGPAKLLAAMPGVHYVGYDPNPRYIDR